MSTAPNFSTVLFVGENNLRLFYLPQKNWHSLDIELDLDNELPSEASKRIRGENVLVVVSDSFNGHLQFTQENKKASLKDEAILNKLEEDFEIDTEAYHLDWQPFSMNRQVVQLCISGIEQEILNKVTTWLKPAQPKKVWAMPFAWFVSTLKSVDPALIAIYDQDEVHVSHHYLGIDDARVLSLEDLDKYVAARREERKETHLLYVAASNQDRSELDKAIKQEGVTTQSLLEESSNDVLLDVVSAATEKGQGAWNELWHVDLSSRYEAADNEDQENNKEKTVALVSATKEEMGEADSTDAASSLPVPTPPSSVSEVGESEEVLSNADEKTLESEAARPISQQADISTTKSEELTDDSKESVTPVKTGSPKSEEENVSTDDENESNRFETPKLTETSNSETDEINETLRDTIDEADKAAVPDIKPVLTEQLKGSGVKANNSQRYAPVEASRSWRGPILVFFIVVILTALVGGAVFWSQEGAQYLGFIDTFVEQPTPKPTPTPEATMEPTPEATQEALIEEPELSSSQKEETSVLVLNATGIAGLAGRTRSTLQDAGWENVAVGNASGTYNDADFIVSDNEIVVDVLAKDLNRELTTVDSVKEPEAANYDVVIILASD